MAEPALLVVLVVLAAVCSADDGGRRTRLALPNGVQTDYTYAANDRLMSLVTTKGAATLASFAYAHDAVGNRTGITLANGETLAYTYDNAYRLTRELRKDAAQQTLFDQTFVYDAVGNRVSTVKNGITSTYVYSNANQLTTETTGNTVKTYTYDANGSQTLIETRVSGQLTVTEQTWYDQLSRRTQYTKTVGGTPTSESFTYRGAAWHRRTQTASGVSTTFLYDGDNVACDFIAGSLDSLYITPFLDENLSLTRQSATHYYTHDGLGSVRSLTDSAGALVNAYAYTAFGEPYAPGTSLTLPQRYTFTGREQNPVSDTMFYRWRTYSAALGRLGTRDPLLYAGSPDGNLYAYVSANPVVWIDPFGQRRWDFWEIVTNACAGFADTITFGGTNLARRALGDNMCVYPGGIDYDAGEAGGIVFRQAAKIIAAPAAPFIAAAEVTEATAGAVKEMVGEPGTMPGGLRAPSHGPLNPGGNPLPGEGGASSLTEHLPGIQDALRNQYPECTVITEVVDKAEQIAGEIQNDPAGGANVLKKYTKLAAEEAKAVLKDLTSGDPKRVARAINKIAIALIVVNAITPAPNGGDQPKKTPERKPSRQIRKEWEEAKQKPWPRDPKSGRNQDVSHKTPISDGGTNDLDNVEPKPHGEHTKQHKDAGDFKRWGGRRK